MKKTFLTLALTLLCTATWAATRIDGIYYNLNDDGTAEVTNACGGTTDCSTKYSGSVNIPSSVTYRGKTYTVTSIGDVAFQSCTGLTSITIPDSVTSIGQSAFSRCTGLTSVTIGTGVTSIGASAFNNCKSLTSITIPNSVTSIGQSAFEYCEGLTNVTIGNSVTSIGNYAFRNCTGLPIIDNCRYADTYLIEAVDKTLATYTIKDGTKFIGSNAFSGCTGLTSIEIPNSVTSIGGSAFSGCTGLTSITIPSSVTSIGKYAFTYCSALTSIAIPNSVTSIGSSAFMACKSLKSITIPNSVTIIPGKAFSDCIGLESVVIGSGVKTIYYDAFYACKGLQSITCYSLRPPAVITNYGESRPFYLNIPYSTIVYVLADYQPAYMMHDIWGLYDVRPLGAASVQADDLTITPHQTTVDVTWPLVANAATYELTIAQGNVVICALTFNAQGQLASIDFQAPAAESARAAGQGFQFTVTGLEDGSAYSLTLNAQDVDGNVLQTFSQDFSTYYTAIEEVNADGVALKPRKVLEEGRVIILMPDGRKFDTNGRALGK